MTDKKGLMERIFGKKDPCCCCETKIVPKPSSDTDTQENGDYKRKEQ